MLQRTFPPSVAPVTLTPTMMPTKDNGSSNSSVIVISVVVVLAGLGVFYRRRTSHREE
jgi:LPXTG-motif cell wall-anchored protein